MILSIIFITFVVAVICHQLAWRRMGCVLYIVSALLFLGVGCGPIPRWLITTLQSAYVHKPIIKWGKRNAIVLLGAGAVKIPHTPFVEPTSWAYANITAAAECYQACHKTGADCKIIVSGGDPAHYGVSEAFAYKQVLHQLGIPPTDIWQEGRSLNTWQNAQFTQPLLQRYQADCVLLVSGAKHLRRSVLYFSHFGIYTTPVRADFREGILSGLPISYNFIVTDIALHEYLGIARYYVYTKLGWNPRRLRTGHE